MNKIFGFLVAYATTLQQPTCTNADIAQGANRAEFLTLCKILQLHGGKPQTTEPQLKGDTIEHELNKLNLTLSEEDWKKKFNNGGASSNDDQKIPDDKKSDQTWTDRWPKWLKAREETKTAEKEAEVLRQANMHTLTAVQKKWAAQQLQPILERVEQINRLQKQEYPTTKFAVLKTAQTTIKEEIYGKQASGDNDVGTSKLYGGNSAKPTTVQQACTGAGESHKAATVVGTILCLCAKATSGVEGSCVPRQAYTTTWNPNTPNDQAAWTDLAKYCPQRLHKEFTAQELKEHLLTLRTAIHSDGTNRYLGAYLQNNCDGNAANGICVKYNNAAAAAANLDKVPWIDKPNTLAHDLSAAEKAVSEAEKLNEKLEAEKTKALLLFAGAQKVVETHNPVDGRHQTPEQRKQPGLICGAHNKSKTACLGAKCKWGGQKDDDGPCVVDESKVAEQTTQAGTGNGSAGTSASIGCERHGTDKAKCEAEKTGDKQNCAWRKGKEGEDDKYTETWRNGSFLVNKKLALSMAVVFLSFVTF
uniref:Variant surface glycoprotein 379 n=1 Tax=Trypanosoma brucei TaxID=5691 RepID=M4TD44_9TRYP|nr:variant surface glycoprotein 379 [Trypanosoma brucei]